VREGEAVAAASDCCVEINATLNVNVKVSVGFSTKECFWWSINANIKSESWTNPDLIPHKLFEANFKEKMFLRQSFIGKVWPCGVMVKVLACDSRSREFNSRPSRCQVTTFAKLFTHVSLSPSSWIMMPCEWDGNCRSVVALAMRQRLKWFILRRAKGPSKGDEHPTNTLHGVWYSLPLFIGTLTWAGFSGFPTGVEFEQFNTCYYTL